MKKKTIDAWGIQTDPYMERIATRQELVKEELRPRRFSVKCCPECNKAYEVPRQTTGEIIKLGRYYLDDFPTYGLERKNCYKCEGEIVHEECTA